MPWTTAQDRLSETLLRAAHPAALNLKKSPGHLRPVLLRNFTHRPGLLRNTTPCPGLLHKTTPCPGLLRKTTPCTTEQHYALPWTTAQDYALYYCTTLSLAPDYRRRFCLHIYALYYCARIHLTCTTAQDYSSPGLLCLGFACAAISRPQEDRDAPKIRAALRLTLTLMYPTPSESGCLGSFAAAWM